MFVKSYSESLVFPCFPTEPRGCGHWIWRLGTSSAQRGEATNPSEGLLLFRVFLVGFCLPFFWGIVGVGFFFFNNVVLAFFLEFVGFGFLF